MKKLLLFSSMLSLLFIVSCRKDNSFPSSSGSAAANCRPVMNTQNQENVTSTSATLKGRIVVPACDTSSSKMQGFVFNDAPLPTLADDVFMVNDTNMSYQVSNLNPGTTYYYRTFYQNDSNAYYGNEISFNTMGSGGGGTGGGTGGGGTGGGGSGGGGTGGGGSNSDSLILDFENSVNFPFPSNDGQLFVTQNAHKTGINTSNYVMLLSSATVAPQTYGDVYIQLGTYVKLNSYSKIKLKIYNYNANAFSISLHGSFDLTYTISSADKSIQNRGNWQEVTVDLSNAQYTWDYDVIRIKACPLNINFCDQSILIDDIMLVK